MNISIIEQTQRWLEDIVIGLNFCPFAKKIFKNDAINYFVDESVNVEDCLYELLAQLKALDTGNNIETSLIIYTNIYTSFNEYLDFLDLANQLLINEGYEGVYQIASFHPQYCFEGSKVDDAANYTNRSPYPMLHLLREQRLEEALEHYPDAEDIPMRNIEVAQNKGLVFFTTYLNNLKRR